MFDSKYLTDSGPTLSFIYYSSFHNFLDRLPAPTMIPAFVQIRICISFFFVKYSFLVTLFILLFHSLDDLNCLLLYYEYRDPHTYPLSLFIFFWTRVYLVEWYTGIYIFFYWIQK